MNYPELAAPWECKVTARALSCCWCGPKELLKQTGKPK